MRTTATGPSLNITYTINRTPANASTLRVTATVHPPDNLVNFTFFVTEAPVTNSSGFSHVAPGEWQWSDDSSVTAPKLVYRIDSNRTDAFGIAATETDSWAFTVDTAYELAFTYWYSSPAPTEHEHFETAGQGYATGDFAYLGPYTRHETASATQSFVYIEPAAAEPALAHDTTLALLRNLSAHVEIGARDQQVTLYVLPPPIRAGGAAGDHSFWISENGTRVTLTHEYVHTRQRNWNATAAMAWLVEGHAEYSGYYYLWQLGQLNGSTLREHLVQGPNMTRPLDSVGGTSLTAYEKGSLTLAKVDLLIRNRSDGRHTLEDVFRRVNRRAANHSTLTLTDFEAAIVHATNVSVNETLERYVTTDAVPTLPSNLTAAYSTPTNQTTDAALDLSITTRSAAPNTTTTVDFTVTNTNGTELTDVAINVTALPGNWTITSHRNDGGTWTARTHTWVWPTLADGHSKTPSLTLRVPNSTEPGNYTIRAIASDAQDHNVTASATITVTEGDATSIDRAIAGEDRKLSLAELQNAIQYWADGEAVPGTNGKTIDLAKLQALIQAWANGETV